MKMKDWEDIKPVWQEYAQEQFGKCVNHYDRFNMLSIRMIGTGAQDGGRQVKGG
jgi:hypothetical protein